MGKNTKVMAKCHINRLHKAKGLCNSCYNIKLENRLDKDLNYKESKLIRRRKKYKDKVLNNPSKIYKDNLRFILKRYNITEEDYNIMVVGQNNLCLICNNSEKTNKRLCVDHNHETGKIRGLLCSNCNRGIGLLKDSIVNLEKAKQYLIKNQA